MNGTLARLRAAGFDESHHIPFTKQYRAKCSQCEACAINGVACHETGCPNQTFECRGCNATVARRGSYCEDSLAGFLPLTGIICERK
jgi:hypothetical protein